MDATATEPAAGSVGCGEPDCAPAGEDEMRTSTVTMMAETSRTADYPLSLSRLPRERG
jgi:hypothetical protein